MKHDVAYIDCPNFHHFSPDIQQRMVVWSLTFQLSTRNPAAIDGLVSLSSAFGSDLYNFNSQIITHSLIVPLQASSYCYIQPTPSWPPLPFFPIMSMPFRKGLWQAQMQPDFLMIIYICIGCNTQVPSTCLRQVREWVPVGRAMSTLMVWTDGWLLAGVIGL